MMRTLRLRNVGWCEAHGHPVATLGVGGDSAFVGVAISVADAQAMSIAAVSALQFGSQGGAADGCRVYGLLELVMGSLGGRVDAIDLTVGTDRIVRSWLKLEGPLGACTVPATFSDALVLSQTLAVPLRIDGEAFDRLMGGSHGQSAPELASEPPAKDGLEVYRAFIDGLDLEHLG